MPPAPKCPAAVKSAGKVSPAILHADDEPVTRHCVSRALAQAGYSVTSAADGLEAWKALVTGNFDLANSRRRSPACLWRKVHFWIVVSPATPGGQSAHKLPRAGRVGWPQVGALVTVA